MKNIYKVLVGVVLALLLNPVTVNAEGLTADSIEYQMWQQLHNKPH